MEIWGRFVGRPAAKCTRVRALGPKRIDRFSRFIQALSRSGRVDRTSRLPRRRMKLASVAAALAARRFAARRFAARRSRSHKVAVVGGSRRAPSRRGGPRRCAGSRRPSSWAPAAASRPPAAPASARPARPRWRRSVAPWRSPRRAILRAPRAPSAPAAACAGSMPMAPMRMPAASRRAACPVDAPRPRRRSSRPRWRGSGSGSVLGRGPARRGRRPQAPFAEVKVADPTAPQDRRFGLLRATRVAAVPCARRDVPLEPVLSRTVLHPRRGDAAPRRTGRRRACPVPALRSAEHLACRWSTCTRFRRRLLSPPSAAWAL